MALSSKKWEFILISSTYKWTQTTDAYNCPVGGKWAVVKLIQKLLHIDVFGCQIHQNICHKFDSNICWEKLSGRTLLVSLIKICAWKSIFKILIMAIHQSFIQFPVREMQKRKEKKRKFWKFFVLIWYICTSFLLVLWICCCPFIFVTWVFLVGKLAFSPPYNLWRMSPETKELHARK